MKGNLIRNNIGNILDFYSWWGVVRWLHSSSLAGILRSRPAFATTKPHAFVVARHTSALACRASAVKAIMRPKLQAERQKHVNTTPRTFLLVQLTCANLV